MTEHSERLDEREEQWVFLELGKSRCGCCGTERLFDSPGSCVVPPPPDTTGSVMRR